VNCSTLHYIPPDTIQRSEISKRDGKIEEITEKFTAEHELRQKIEQERNELKVALVGDDNTVYVYVYVPASSHIFQL